MCGANLSTAGQRRARALQICQAELTKTGLWYPNSNETTVVGDIPANLSSNARTPTADA